MLPTDDLELGGLDDEALFSRVQAGAAEARVAIEQAKRSIHEGDMPLEELGPVLEDLKAKLRIETGEGTDGFAGAVEGWLEGARMRDRALSWGGAGLSLGLGIGALLASGGTAVVLGTLGIGVGFGSAGYDYERATDLDIAARAGPGGRPLTDDVEGASFRRTMAFVGLVLAGVDLGGAVRAGTTLLRGQRALRALAEGAAGEVIGRLGPKPLHAVDAALKQFRAGDAKAAEAALAPLEETLDPRALRRLRTGVELVARNPAGLDRVPGPIAAELADHLDVDTIYHLLDEASVSTRRVTSAVGAETVARLSKGLTGLEAADLVSRLGRVPSEDLLRLTRHLSPKAIQATTEPRLLSALPLDTKPEHVSTLLTRLGPLGLEKLAQQTALSALGFDRPGFVLLEGQLSVPVRELVSALDGGVTRWSNQLDAVVEAARDRAMSDRRNEGTAEARCVSMWSLT